MLRTTRPAHTPFDPPHDVVGYLRQEDGSTSIVSCRWAGALEPPPSLCALVIRWTPPS